MFIVLYCIYSYTENCYKQPLTPIKEKTQAISLPIGQEATYLDMPSRCLHYLLLKYLRNIYVSSSVAYRNMRLTTELLSAAPSFLNPINDRELDLRGLFPKSRCYTFDLWAVLNIQSWRSQDSNDWKSRDCRGMAFQIATPRSCNC